MTSTNPLPARFAGRTALAALVVLAAALGPIACRGGHGRGANGATTGAQPAAPAAIAGAPAGLQFLPPEPGTYALPAIQPAADGAVLDRDGRPHRLFDYLGDDYVLLAFIYSRCSVATACPLATRVYQQLRRQVAADPQVAGRLRLVTLSFDPAGDTPEVMRAYAREVGAEDGGAEETGGDAAVRREAWSFLTTASQADLEPILDAYGQFVVREVGADGRYTGGISHVLKVYLIDPQRQVRNIYSSGFLHPALVINDVKTLLLAEPEA